MRPTHTPRGEYELLRKSHTSYMIGGVGADHYDLPGVAFPSYFTRSAIAVHGTYWHNDYGRPRSHGCVNVSNDRGAICLSLVDAGCALRSTPDRRQARRRHEGCGDLVTHNVLA